MFADNPAQAAIVIPIAIASATTGLNHGLRRARLIGRQRRRREFTALKRPGTMNTSPSAAPLPPSFTVMGAASVDDAHGAFPVIEYEPGSSIVRWLNVAVPWPVQVTEVSPPLKLPPASESEIVSGPLLEPPSSTSTLIWTLNCLPASIE